MTRIRLDPAVPAEAKTEQIAEVVAEVRALKRVRATVVSVDTRFAKHWTEVRKLVARRRAMIANIISSGKHAGSGLHRMMEEHDPIERYVRALLGTYTVIVQRLRSLKAWRKTIGNHYPPEQWQALYRERNSLGLASNGTAWQARVPSIKEMMTVNPLDFATEDERAYLRALDPDDERYPFTRDPWAEMVYARGRTLRYHMYSHHNDAMKESPDWLREFNGYINS